MATWRDVIEGDSRWSCEAADAVEFVRGLPDDSVDLLFCSPPYLKARTYGIDAGRELETWVRWMVDLVSAASPKVKGLIAINCEGQTEDYRYQPGPFLLLADLHRAGFNLRRPAYYHRVGIPGSGGPDWLRGDTEPVVCVTRPGKLPWSDNTACGHAPKWAPGGEMSHRLADGARVNQWGRTGGSESGGARGKDGKRQRKSRPSHVTVPVVDGLDGGPALFNGGEPMPVAVAKEVPKWLREGMHTGIQSKVKNPKPRFREAPDGTVKGAHAQDICAVANPGNVAWERYTSQQVVEMIGEAGDLTHHVVGGNQMGHPLASENEAPFPLTLAAFFVKSFCPPGGVVLDPFSGSGTTCHAAVENNRRFIGADIRQSQVDLCARRLRTITPNLVPA